MTSKIQKQIQFVNNHIKSGHRFKTPAINIKLPEGYYFKHRMALLNHFKTSDTLI